MDNEGTWILSGPQTLKHLEERIEENLHDFGVRKSFTDRTTIKQKFEKCQFVVKIKKKTKNNLLFESYC